MDSKKSEVESYVQGGIKYEKRPVSIDNGTTSIGTVDVPIPMDVDDLGALVNQGIETSQHIAALYVRAKAVDLQQKARAAKKTGKMPQAAFDRLFAELTPEQHAQFREQPNPWNATKAYIAEKYAAEVA